MKTSIQSMDYVCIVQKIYVRKNEKRKRMIFFGAGRVTSVINHSFAKCYVVGFLSYLLYLISLEGLAGAGLHT